MIYDMITFTARKNCGNYEHEELTVAGRIEETEIPVNAIAALKKLVKDSLYGEKTAVSANTTAEKVTPKENKTETKGKVEKTEEKPLDKKSEAKKEEPKKEEPKAEEPKVEEKKEEKKTTSKKETTVKAPATKETMYDREHKPHKALLGKYLDEVYPSWRNEENLKKAGAASRALQGKPFQDGEGNILQAFKDEFAKYMA